jgi:probable rRNA maturation factor
LNKQFRGEDCATDVLSFAGADPASLGDIAISLQRARAQAGEFGHSVEQEVSILMLHGVLHLMGMDHQAGDGRMARAEKRWRVRLGLAHGLIERVRQ